MDKEELVKMCYEQKITNLESGRWAKKLGEQLSKIGLGYIWQDLSKNSVSGTCKASKVQ